ncbi:MAG TPA: SPASM domain-containing protein [Thermoanaerobaculia bacterium]|nr:SPASM domain-containing protein [Thermoanaerobaculia bacterium]
MSSYVIFVNLPDSEDEVLLVHGYTGAYDKVSRRVAGFLRSRGARTAASPLYGAWSEEADAAEPVADPSDSLIEHLCAQGYLTELSSEQEETFFGRLATRLHERALQQPPSYIFMPTYDCNLRCSYCYQDHMRSDCNLRHLLRTMQPPMVDRIFAALPKIEALHGVAPGSRHRRNIGFFGGEPLLAANRPVVEHILARAFDLGPVDVWAVSNGTELAAYRDLLGPVGIAMLQITLDGPPPQHDRRRIYADGSGSYERIAGGIDLALAEGAVVSLRINVDRTNLADLPAVARELAARGWAAHPGFAAYTSPVRAGNGKTDPGSTFSTWDLDRELTRLRGEHPEVAVLSRPDEGLRARARRIFDTGGEVLPSLRPSFCGAHDRMYIFDPFGDIYSCWERTGDAKIRTGRVLPDGEVELSREQLAVWQSRTVASNPVCRRCRYALHCGGGCAVLALGSNGSYNSNYCDGFSSRFQASLAEAYRQHLAGGAPVALREKVCDL